MIAWLGRLVLLGFAVAAVPVSGVRAEAAELIMVQEAGCVWCARWDAEIAEIYPKTPEGRAAPLRRIDKRAPVPADLTLVRPVSFTPTFVLVQDGRELARIEGYPGEEFFWALLGKILREKTVFDAGT